MHPFCRIEINLTCPWARQRQWYNIHVAQIFIFSFQYIDNALAMNDLDSKEGSI